MWAADLELGAVDALKKGSGKAVRPSLAILTLVWLHLLGLYTLVWLHLLGLYSTYYSSSAMPSMVTLLWPAYCGSTHHLLQVRICLGHHAVTGSEPPGKAMRVLEVKASPNPDHDPDHPDANLNLRP